MQENWTAIHYVSGNKDAQKLLSTLHERGRVGFDLISQFAGKSFAVIKKLDSLNLIETDKSRTYGYTEEGRIRESFYQLSSLGSAWFPALMSLAAMTENIIAVQINLGEFPRLTKELEIFISSDDPEEVRTSFEFIFGNDFHERTKHKLNNLRDTATSLRADLISVANENSFKRHSETLTKQIADFEALASEILATLIAESSNIKISLHKLETLTKTNFYKERSLMIEGSNALRREDRNTEDILQTIVLNFVQKLKRVNIHEDYTKRITAVIKTLNDIDGQLKQLKFKMETKGKLLDLANTFFQMESAEEANELFNSILSNKKIHHISLKEGFSHINGSTLVITMPDAKPRLKTRTKIDQIEKDYRKKESLLADKKEELKALTKELTFLETGLQASYDPKTYNFVVNALMEEATPFGIPLNLVKSRNDTIIETQLANEKTARFILKNKELKLERKTYNAHRKKKATIEGEISRLTHDLNHHQYHQKKQSAL